MARARIRRSIEDAAQADLDRLPALYGESGPAEAYLMAARRLDAGVATRDLSPLLREIRQGFLALHELAPGRAAGDPGDELAAKREVRMLQQRVRELEELLERHGIPAGTGDAGLG